MVRPPVLVAAENRVFGSCEKNELGGSEKKGRRGRVAWESKVRFYPYDTR